MNDRTVPSAIPTRDCIVKLATLSALQQFTASIIHLRNATRQRKVFALGNSRLHLAIFQLTANPDVRKADKLPAFAKEKEEGR
ncbi:hypothetical protein V6R21_28175 [Limibacter armeniacum]|uniref:hypothetical protein n=1 Tax=Limibacter armeniacum TaxID=466084 RepID=UPI002FE5D70E